MLEFAPDRGMNAVGGEVLRSCMQCGTCSAICPMSDYMDHSPRALNAMLLAGRSGDVLRSRAVWACTSCYACTVECPKQLPVTDTIYALRRASIRADLQPRRFSTPILVSRFVDLVDKRGRSNEFWVSMSLSLRTSPGLLLEYAPLGLRLLRRGRMTVRHGSLRRVLLRLPARSPVRAVRRPAGAHVDGAAVRGVRAEPIDWPLRTRCCGGSCYCGGPLIGNLPDATLRLSHQLLEDAVARG